MSDDVVRVGDPMLHPPTASANGTAAVVDGAAFFLDAPEHVMPIWGDEANVLWAQGEPFMLCGPDGVGKTTLAQQLMFARAGVTDRLDLLGQTVAPDPSRAVLYLALDRSRQAARSGRRMVGEPQRKALSDRLMVATQMPFDVVTNPDALATWAAALGAGTIVVDSLKDLAPAPLSEEAVGMALNRSFQRTVGKGIEVLLLHHQRKAQAENKKPRQLADVYGSRWLTAGCGSVVMLWGDPGDPIVELTHLKQPVDVVGPLTLLHDNRSGTTTVADAPDVVDLVAANSPADAKTIAKALYAIREPKRPHIEKARRRLDAEVEQGRLERHDAPPGGAVTWTATFKEPEA
jgi:hypothetical protein